MSNSVHEQEIIIRPPSKLASLNLRELYNYRHMLWSMVWRDIRVQFSDMYLGFFWAVSRPVAMVTVFTLLRRFSKANMYVTIPYSVYVYSGLIFWYYFMESTVTTSRSIAKDATLIKKVYFPRMITPLVPTISSLYGLGLATVPLAIMMAWHKVYPGWQFVLLPAVLLQCIILSLGIGTMIASLSLTHKDAEKFLNLILYVGLFISPVIYTPDMIPESGRLFYYLNPMAGTLLAFRSCVFSDFPFPLMQWAYSVIVSLFFLVLGTTMFRKAEVYFADKL